MSNNVKIVGKLGILFLIVGCFLFKIVNMSGVIRIFNKVIKMKKIFLCFRQDILINIMISKRIYIKNSGVKKVFLIGGKNSFLV